MIENIGLVQYISVLLPTEIIEMPWKMHKFVTMVAKSPENNAKSDFLGKFNQESDTLFSFANQ